VRQLDFFEEPHNYYIVLEYLTGGELFDRIVSKSNYNEKEARDCVKLALRALKYIHELNIVHRLVSVLLSSFPPDSSYR
jgi:calcium/calmodulin-dependent protein kinase I